MFLSGDDVVLGWGCSKCKGDDFADGDEFRAIRNCDSSQNENIAWEWMPSLRRCPWSQIDDETWMILNWWIEWREFKALPFEGSDITTQPAFVIESLLLLQEIQHGVEREKTKRQQKESEKASKKRVSK